MTVAYEDGEIVSHTVLRRVPTQERSRDVVRRILAATEELLVTVGFEETARSQAEILKRAGATRGTFYTYFESCEAALEELSLQNLLNCKVIIDRVAAQRYDSWGDAVDAVVEGFVNFYQTPAVREIWMRHHLTPAARRLGAATNEYIALRTRDMVMQASQGRMRRSDLRYVVASELGDRLLRLAFERDPAGDVAVIEQVKLAMRACIAAPEPSA